MKTALRFPFTGLLIACVALLVSRSLFAENPIIQTSFTADPAPMVHDGVLYLYTSHDEDSAAPGMGNFLMRDWKCYSTTDMVNWTDHGAIASLANFPWAVQSNDAWAPQVVERNGKFYLYVPISVEGSPKNVIAVAVADNPLGPFKDALGRPLIDKKDGFIDPTVFIDDDGQAYLYFGNPKLWYVKLNPDMISYSGGIVEEPTKPANYQEGPWFYKRLGHYYMAYASTCCPEGIGYAMSDHPTGPWAYQGYIVRPNEASSGNHPGIVDYKGDSYVFGFNYKLNFALTNQHHERRSVCAAKLDYKPDGTIVEHTWWTEAGVPQVGTFDPYHRVEAETIAWSEGVKTERGSQSGMSVYPTRSGGYVKVKGVEFGQGAKTLHASLSSSADGCVLEVRLDGPTGPLVGTCAVPNTGDPAKWATVSLPVRSLAGLHDLVFVMRTPAGTRFNFDWWQFE